MDRPDRLAEIFRRAGLRWTPQRESVAAALSGATTHPTAEEIYATVRRRNPGIAKATVYNTIDALVSVGQLETIASGSGPRRYDPNSQPHHHMLCITCGRIDDLPLDAVAAIPRLASTKTASFTVLGYRIEYRGLCPRCGAGRGGRSKSAASSPGAPNRER